MDTAKFLLMAQSILNSVANLWQKKEMLLGEGILELVIILQYH